MRNMSTQAGHYLDWKYCTWFSYQSSWGRRRPVMWRRWTVISPADSWVNTETFKQTNKNSFQSLFVICLHKWLKCRQNIFSCRENSGGGSSRGRGGGVGVSLKIELWKRWKVYLIYFQGKMIFWRFILHIWCSECESGTEPLQCPKVY